MRACSVTTAETWVSMPKGYKADPGVLKNGLIKKQRVLSFCLTIALPRVKERMGSGKNS